MLKHSENNLLETHSFTNIYDNSNTQDLIHNELRLRILNQKLIQQILTHYIPFFNLCLGNGNAKMKVSEKTLPNGYLYSSGRNMS